MLISLLFSFTAVVFADQGYRWPAVDPLPAEVRTWLPDEPPCARDLGETSTLPHRQLVKLAGLPRVMLIDRVRELVPRDRFRVFNYVLRAQLGGKRGALLRTRGHDMQAEYDGFFMDLRRVGLSQADELTLLRQAMEFSTFEMSPLVLHGLDFDPDVITRIFARPSSLRTVVRLRQSGLWGRLASGQRAGILAHLLENNGWMIIGGETRLLDADRLGLFRTALYSRGTRENDRTITSIRGYLASPTLNDHDRESLLEIAIQRNIPSLTRSLLENLDRLKFSADANLRIKSSILNSASTAEVMRVLEHSPEGLTEPLVLAAVRRVVAAGLNAYQGAHVLRISARLIRSDDGRFLLFSELVTVAPTEVLSAANVARYHIPPEDVYRLFMRAPPNNADEILLNLRNRFGDGFVPRLELAQDPRRVLTGARVNEFVPVADLKANLEDFQRRYPDSVSEWEARLPWDLAWREDTGIKLIKHLMGRPPGDLVAYNNSREIISELLFGDVRPAFVEALAAVSDDRAGTLYELVLGAVSHRAPPMLPPTVHVDPELWRKKNFPRFVEFLTAVRDWEMVYRRAPQDFLKPITTTNIDSITLELRERLVDAIREKFGRGPLEITAEKLFRLRELWGDLHPIFTLSSRYLGERRWRPSLDVLARIFSADLAGAFTDYKYGGFPGDPRDQAAAALQLRVLDTPERVSAWRTNHAVAKVVSAQDGRALQSASDLRAIAVANIRGGLAGHVKLDRIRSTPADQENLLREIMSSRDLRLENAGVLRGDIPAIVLKALLAEPRDEEIQAYATFLVRHWISLKLDPQVHDDLRAIRAAYVVDQQVARTQIIVTTSFDDAKTLLMIGDLVQTSSCQNYKTGGLAHTLPSYVIDAHVKGLASFALKAIHFGGPNDFEVALSLIHDADPRTKITYDGGHRRFTFTAANGQSVTTLPLERAHHRQILRLGTNRRTKGPGLFLERSYQQSHEWQRVMKAQTAEIFDRYHRSIDTEDGGDIRIEKTRNPLGAWSDAVWGVRQSAMDVKN